MSIPQSAWDEALAVIDGAEEIALSCHEGPDGDALGSMLALAIALEQRGVRTTSSWGSERFSVPRQYSFLPRLDLVSQPAAFPAMPGVLVTFDAGSFERFGTLEPNARAAKTLVVVDHHASNDHFGHINLVDPNAAASAVIVYDLLRAMGHSIDGDIATCLYTGLVTDTGRFQYANTTPRVHNIAADLIERGAPHVKITEVVYNTHPVGFLRLASVALSRLRIRGDASLAWSWVTTEDLAKSGVEMEDIEALIDLVRTADVADVAAVLKQQADGRYRVSMRSKGGANVGAVCTSFGGGGHALAAGFTATGTDPERIVDDVAAALRAYA